jgi:hypothetical protein
MCGSCQVSRANPEGRLAGQLDPLRLTPGTSRNFSDCRATVPADLGGGRLENASQHAGNPSAADGCSNPLF